MDQQHWPFLILPLRPVSLHHLPPRPISMLGLFYVGSLQPFGKLLFLSDPTATKQLITFSSAIPVKLIKCQTTAVTFKIFPLWQRIN